MDRRYLVRGSTRRYAMLTKLSKCHGMDVAARVEEVGVHRRVNINEATDPARFNAT
jgi:hypothetical protein